MLPVRPVSWMSWLMQRVGAALSRLRPQPTFTTNSVPHTLEFAITPPIRSTDRWLFSVQLPCSKTKRTRLRHCTLLSWGHNQGCGSSLFWCGSGSCSSSKWWESATTGLQTAQDSILSLQASFVSVHGPPRLHFEPLKPLKFYFNADPDSTFHSYADPDTASENNADPDPNPQHWS